METRNDKISVKMVIIMVVLGLVITIPNILITMNNQKSSVGEFSTFQEYRVFVESQALEDLAVAYKIEVNEEEVKKLADDVVNENKGVYKDDLIKDPEITVQLVGEENFNKSFRNYYIEKKLVEVLSKDINPTEEELSSLKEVYTDTLEAQGIKGDEEITKKVTEIFKEDKVYSQVNDLKKEYQNKIINEMLTKQKDK